MLTKLNCDSVNEFLEACQGRCILGERPNGNDCQFYQLEIGDKSYSVCVSGQRKPKTENWGEKFLLLLADRLYIFKTHTGEILKTIQLDVSIYDFEVKSDVLYVFGELDIVAIDSNLTELKHIALSGILTDYQIEGNKIKYTTDDNNTYCKKI